MLLPRLLPVLALTGLVATAAAPALAGPAAAASSPAPSTSAAPAAAPAAGSPTPTPDVGLLDPPRAAGLGYDRIGVRRGGTWQLRDSLDGGPGRAYAEETAGWQPVAGDTDGDGTSTVSLFRDGVWLLRDSEGGTARVVRFGQKGDVPVLGDWDGDGTATLGLFRSGRWFLRSSNLPVPVGYTTFGFGVGGDRPVVGDWDADGDTDIAVTRGATWFQRDAANAGPSSRHFSFGRPGDLPVAGDWDHDGRDTPGLFRDGTWFFKLGNGFGGYQTTVFGARGDRPVVRRTPGLAPGVTHRVVRSGGSVAQVVAVTLSAASSPDVVLSGGDLRGLERVSSMARRTGAAVAVNGDYFLSSGRPVHALAVDGRLLQTPQLLGRAFSLDASGTRVQMGYPDSRVVLDTAAATGAPAASATVNRWNSGGPDGGDLAAYTPAGSGLDEPAPDRCWAGLTEGPSTVRPDGGVDSTMTVTGTRCYGPAPLVTTRGPLLAAVPSTTGEDLIRSLRPGQRLPATTHLGFPGAVDVLGGTPLLLKDGQAQSASLTGSGSFFQRQPRTAVGTTPDGTLLVVTVDGRQSGWSTGMTLVELADLMQRLGARDALNLDGGGSTTMTLNGLVVGRPSDGVERPVGTALVVLPGGDPGQTDLRAGTSTRSASPRLRAAAPAPAVGAVTEPAGPGWRAAAADPGSIGGLADALVRAGTPLPADLRRADAVFDATRR